MFSIGNFIPLLVVVVLGLVLATSTIKIVQEYERGVIFRPGRLVGARGPGLILLLPGAERMRKVDLRIVTLEVPAQEAITRDNVTVKVNAVVYFRVVDPEEAVVKVLDYVRATSLIGQTTLRSILGQSDLDHLLSERDKINAELQQVIDTQTNAWGVKVTSVEVRDLELPQSMQRAARSKAIMTTTFAQPCICERCTAVTRNCQADAEWPRNTAEKRLVGRTSSGPIDLGGTPW